MRLFIGIPFPDTVRSQIGRRVAAIRPYLAKGRLGLGEGYHITLKFLGEVSEQDAAALSLLLADTPFQTQPFEMTFTEPGYFRKRGGDILWLGVTLPPQLISLQQEIETLAKDSGFPPENRAYTPHLTLGRGVRYSESFEETVKHWPSGNIRTWVDRVCLFQSVQVDGRLTYVPLVTLWLGNKNSPT